MAERSPGILVVDDDEAVARLLKQLMLQLTDDITVAHSGEEALSACNRRSFDLVISDMRMPGIDGIELMHLLAVDFPSTRRVIITGHADLEHAMKAINEGRVNRYMTKPWEADEFLAAIRDELRAADRERAEIKRLREAIDRLSNDAEGDAGDR